MGNFNRGSRQGGGRDFKRGGFRDRDSRGPAQMHQAVCDNCGKNCEVPFRPTIGKPIFCSSCFESNRGSDSRNFSSKGGPSSGWEEKRMFEAVCDECGNSCKVPFQPSGGKPVYCSNCFGEKKGAGDRSLEVLNNKLDRILQLLDKQPQPRLNRSQESVVVEKTKVAKKKPSAKK